MTWGLGDLAKKHEISSNLVPLDFGFYVSNKDYKSRFLSTSIVACGIYIKKNVFWIRWMGT
jgi:hypothetical protein